MKAKWVVVAVALFGGVAVMGQAPAGSPVYSKPEVGRYQIVTNPSLARDTFLIDTATGKVWARRTADGADGEVWLHMERADNDREFEAWVDAHKSAPVTPGIANPLSK